MAHQICQQSNIIVFLQEVLGIPVTEGVRVYHLFIQSVFVGIVFELLGDATGGNTLPIAIQKQIAGGTV